MSWCLLKAWLKLNSVLTDGNISRAGELLRNRND